MNPCHSLNQLFTDPEDKDVQPVHSYTHGMKNDCTLVLDKEHIQGNPNRCIIPIKNNGNFHHD